MKGTQELGIQASEPFPECTSRGPMSQQVSMAPLGSQDGQNSSHLLSLGPHLQALLTHLPWPLRLQGTLRPFPSQGSCTRALLPRHPAAPTHVHLHLMVSPSHPLPWGPLGAPVSVIRTFSPTANFYLRDYFIDICLPKRLGAPWGPDLSSYLVIAVPQRLARRLG